MREVLADSLNLWAIECLASCYALSTACLNLQLLP